MTDIEWIECGARGCPAKSLVILFNKSGEFALEFCGNHYWKYRTNLLLEGFEIIVDDRLPGQRFEQAYDPKTKSNISDTPAPVSTGSGEERSVDDGGDPVGV